MNRLMLSLLVIIVVSGSAWWFICRRLEIIAKPLPWKSATRLPNYLPLGLDHLWRIFMGDKDGYLLHLFHSHFCVWGTTIEYVLLGVKALGTIEPANIQCLLSSGFQDWSTGRDTAALSPLFGRGIFTQDGEEWKRSRDVLRPQLFHRHFGDLTIFREPVERLIRSLPQHRPVDVQVLLRQMTLEVILNLLCGAKFEPPGGYQAICNFARDFDILQKFATQRTRWSKFYWLIGGTSLLRARENVRRFVNSIIDQNISGDPQTLESRDMTFVQQLRGHELSDSHLRDQFINMIVAGKDTTASLISWTLFLLARHPRVLQKLRNEIESRLGESIEINRLTLHGLPYLQHILKETLRLYPPVPINSRIAARDTILPIGGGSDSKSPVFVLQGTVVTFDTYSMHRLPKLYGMDAELFRPERWNESMPREGDPINAKWSYLPFHGGPRTCLGQDFALTQAAYTIVQFLQANPVIELPPDESIQVVGAEKQIAGMTLLVANGCNLVLRNRG